MSAKAASAGRRLTPKEWAKAEEMYANGHTQKEVAEKFGIRIETVSRHMTAAKIKGGEKLDKVREENLAKIAAMEREYAEKMAFRSIYAKEQLAGIQLNLLQAFGREFKVIREGGHSLASLQATAKALRESVASLKLAREELYCLLEINPDAGTGEKTKIVVEEMTAEEEAALRNRTSSFGEEVEEEVPAPTIEEITAAAEEIPEPDTEAEEEE